jgi:hypothetical protein
VYKPCLCRESKHDSSELQPARSLHSTDCAIGPAKRRLIVAGCGATRRVSQCCCVVATPSLHFHTWVKSKAVPVYSMKACGGLELQLHSFLASAVDGGEWSASRPDLPPTPRKIPVPIKRLGGKSCPCRGWNPGLSSL